MGRVLCRARLGLLPRVGGVGPSWAIESGLSQERRHHSPSSVVVILRQVSLGRSSRPRRGSENKRAPSWSHSVASRQPGPRSPWEGPAKPRTGGSKESEAASGTTGARARAGVTWYSLRRDCRALLVCLSHSTRARPCAGGAAVTWSLQVSRGLEQRLSGAQQS